MNPFIMMLKKWMVFAWRKCNLSKINPTHGSHHLKPIGMPTAACLYSSLAKRMRNYTSHCATFRFHNNPGDLFAIQFDSLHFHRWWQSSSVRSQRRRQLASFNDEIRKSNHMLGIELLSARIHDENPVNLSNFLCSLETGSHFTGR